MTIWFNYRRVVSGFGCSADFGFGATTGTYWGTTLVVEGHWSLDAVLFGRENSLTEDLTECDDCWKISGREGDSAGLSEIPPAGRLRSGGMASVGLLGSVAWTMWRRSRPAVVVSRSNSWIRLFWMRTRSLRRISQSFSNAALSSAICTPTTQCCHNWLELWFNE